MQKYILFDLDDTLYPTSHIYESALSASWTEFKRQTRMDLTFDEFKNSYELAKKKTKPPLLNTAASHNRLIYFKRLTEHFLKKTQPTVILALNKAYSSVYPQIDFSETASVLKKLSEKNRLAVITNHTCVTQLEKLAGLETKHDFTFEFVLTSEEAGIEKPDVKIFKEALLRFGSPDPKSVVMVGDSFEADIKPAIDFGFTSFWFKGDDKFTHPQVKCIGALQELVGLV